LPPSDRVLIHPDGRCWWRGMIGRCERRAGAVVAATRMANRSAAEWAPSKWRPGIRAGSGRPPQGFRWGVAFGHAGVERG